MILSLGFLKVRKMIHNYDLSKVIKMRRIKRNCSTTCKKKEILGPIKACLKIRSLSALKESESLKESEKPKTNFSKARIEKIRKEFNESRHNFSKSKINEIRRNLYDIENEKSLFESKRKEIEKNLTELEENLSKTKKYYDYDGIEYKGRRNIKNFFDLLIDEDYYELIITKVAFNNNYIQYESKGDKGKNLSIKKYLNMIRPYLSDITNDHKTQRKWGIHSGNKIIEHN